MPDLKLIVQTLNTERPDIKTGVIPMGNYRRTVREMIRMATTYADDLREYASWPLLRFYRYVRGLPYRRDIAGVETLVRPKYAIRQNWTRWRDCDDKTMLILSYAELRGIPWRVVVVGKGDFPHHVYPALKIAGKWIPADATFPPGQGHKQVSEFGKKLYNEKFVEIFE